MATKVLSPTNYATEPLTGKNMFSGTVSVLNGATTGTVTDSRIKATSKVVLTPANATAGAVWGATASIYVSAVAAGSFTVTCADPTATATFNYIVVTP